MLQSTILRQAMTGDVASEQLVERIIARRAVMLGLHTPQAQVVQIIDATPEQTSTDKIEAVLDELMEMDRAQGASSEEDEPPPY